METGRLLIDGRWIEAPASDPVFNAFDGAAVGTVARGTSDDVDRALDAARRALGRPWPAHERYRVLMDAAARLDAEADELAELIAREGSKTRREARREPHRAAEILRLSAEEARRATGESLPFDIRPGSENRVGYWTRVPAGIVAAIMPFNDPMAVATHKVGPALAGGNAVVLKPDSRTPFSVLRIARAFVEAGLPEGRLNVVTGDGPTVGAALVRDPRVRVVSFTGGVRTGRRIAADAGIKKLVLELGANSAVLVMDDADLDRAVPAIADGAFAQAGQNCLGVQRVLVHEAVYAAFRDRLVGHVRTLRAGHSLDDQVDVCAMIRVEEAERVEAWIREAEQAGARVLVGGRREGAVIWPTVLEGVPEGIRMDCDEVYGPVLALYPVGDLDEGIRRANAVDFGLHAAIFTRSVHHAFRAVRDLEVGGVIVNDSTDYRLDTMPFGGVKSSGLGREGIRHALESMTETKVVCLNL
jgi:glyceraldehyde-3-phosphate dehydrogenase (NADP+)